MSLNQIKIAVGFAIVACLVLVGWMGHVWYSDSVKLAIEEVKNEINVSTAKAISEIKVESKTINAKTIERIKTETVYRDCVADDEMMKLINKALTGE